MATSLNRLFAGVTAGILLIGLTFFYSSGPATHNESSLQEKQLQKLEQKLQRLEQRVLPVQKQQQEQLLQQYFWHAMDAPSESKKQFTLENTCGCKRSVQAATSSNNNGHIPFNQTTCGQDAFLRGSGQKVVGFSFYGDINTPINKRKGYFQGISENLDLMPKFYPGWTMRVYFDLDKDDPIMRDLCKLACENELLDLCHAGQLPGTPLRDARKVFAMNWRFFPTLDPQVELYLCRDLDSRFSDRELAAVNEWLESDQPIHSIRDNPHHYTPLLGAAWGSHMERKGSRTKWRQSWMRMLKDHICWAKRSAKGPDQDILKRYIWPWGRRLSVQHDSYLCKHFPGSIPMPTKRENKPNNFVASVVNENHVLWEPCPVACRPKEHKDWEHC